MYGIWKSLENVVKNIELTSEKQLMGSNLIYDFIGTSFVNPTRKLWHPVEDAK